MRETRCYEDQRAESVLKNLLTISRSQETSTPGPAAGPAARQSGAGIAGGSYTSAIQWLSARQTLGGYCDLAFSQAQAILARSFVPIQDTPAVKFTLEIYFESALPCVCSGEFVGVYGCSSSSSSTLFSSQGDPEDLSSVRIQQREGAAPDNAGTTEEQQVAEQEKTPSFRIHPNDIPFELLLTQEFELLTDDFQTAFPLPALQQGDEQQVFSIGENCESYFYAVIK